MFIKCMEELHYLTGIVDEFREIGNICNIRSIENNIINIHIKRHSALI